MKKKIKELPSFFAIKLQKDINLMWEEKIQDSRGNQTWETIIKKICAVLARMENVFIRNSKIILN